MSESLVLTVAETAALLRFSVDSIKRQIINAGAVIQITASVSTYTVH
jgi:hypothetical protein